MGREAIIGKLRKVSQMHSGFKAAHQVVQVDCQALGVVRGLGGGGGMPGGGEPACMAVSAGPT